MFEAQLTRKIEETTSKPIIYVTWHGTVQATPLTPSGPLSPPLAPSRPFSPLLAPLSRPYPATFASFLTHIATRVGLSGPFICFGISWYSGANFFWFEREREREQRAESRERERERAESREQRAESREQRAREREIERERAESREKRAASREQRAESREQPRREQRAASREQRAERERARARAESLFCCVCVSGVGNWPLNAPWKFFCLITQSSDSWLYQECPGIKFKLPMGGRTWRVVLSSNDADGPPFQARLCLSNGVFVVWQLWSCNQ